MPSFFRDSFSNLKQELATYNQRRASNPTLTSSNTPVLQHGQAAAAAAADGANAPLAPASCSDPARAPLGLPTALPATVPVAHRGTFDSPISVPSGTASDPATAFCTANLHPSPSEPSCSRVGVHPPPSRPASAPLQSHCQYRCRSGCLVVVFVFVVAVVAAIVAASVHAVQRLAHTRQGPLGLRAGAQLEHSTVLDPALGEPAEAFSSVGDRPRERRDPEEGLLEVIILHDAQPPDRLNHSRVTPKSP